MTVRIIQGDCRGVLKTLPDESVHCVVTSPPYFGLRDYGVEGQIGLEPTAGAYVARLVEVFRDVRRVLRDDGTLWLNLGDSYASDAAKGRHKPGGSGKQNYIIERGNGRASVMLNLRSESQGSSDGFVGRGDSAAVRSGGAGLKPKDLIGIPWRVALALQADGWYLRQDIIWSKPNPMPESVRDRCTKAHEYIFLLAKSERYYFDSTVMKEKSKGDFRAGKSGKWADTAEAVGAVYGKRKVTGNQNKGRLNQFSGEFRNRRSVWTVTTKPFKGAHFATFPPDLVEPCVLAGCPAGGTVLDPFGGAGTTGLVAQRHGRNAILCELNPEYAEMARKRIDAESPIKDLL